MTGSGVIYFFAYKPEGIIRSWYSTKAFDWKDGQHIWLPLEMGWCNYWERDGVKSIEFTDNMSEWNCSEVRMRDLAYATDIQRQRRHWKEVPPLAQPADVQLAAQSQGENEMAGTFDPYEAAASQAKVPYGAKLASGRSVRARCETVVDQTLSNNKSAAKAAAYLEAGRIANNQASKQLAKHLPLMVRGYADTPIGKLLVANLVQSLAQHFKPDNQQLAKLAGAMTTQAYAEMLKNFDIEALIDGFLNDGAIKNALSKVEAD